MPHHLLDVVDPDESYSLAHYQSDALAAIERIFSRGRMPVLVGGAGLYVSAVCDGLQLPEVAPDEEFRAALEVRARYRGYIERQQRTAEQAVALESTPTPVTLWDEELNGVSREAREKSEGDVAAQAIARYRTKAADYARQFGYTGYTLREVNVSASEQPPIRPIAMASARAMSAQADESLPVEAGKATVAVTVNGTVQLNK